MEFSEYQNKAVSTDRNPLKSNGSDSIVIPMMGLAGEAGELLTEYKKHLRDGDAHVLYEERIEEELGDILWYVSNIASKFNLKLDEIAMHNLKKTNSRWGKSQTGPRVFDAEFCPKERLPRKFQAEIREANIKGRMKVEVHVSGPELNVVPSPFGDELTDNSYDPDGYRFHDVFHLSYAAILGWSPVTRRLLDRKRRSRPMVDEVEDGGRASAIEEGISALVFEYARNHHFLDGISAIDSQLLRTIKDMTSRLEVNVCKTQEWERAILDGYEVWRIIAKNQHGIVSVDLDNQKISIV